MVAQGMVNNVMLKNNDNDGMMAGNDYRKLVGRKRMYIILSFFTR